MKRITVKIWIKLPTFGVFGKGEYIPYSIAEVNSFEEAVVAARIYCELYRIKYIKITP